MKIDQNEIKMPFVDEDSYDSGFFLNILKRDKKPPECKLEDHEWILIDGKGYDYDADYYWCTKCQRSIYRSEFDLNPNQDKILS